MTPTGFSPCATVSWWEVFHKLDTTESASNTAALRTAWRGGERKGPSRCLIQSTCGGSRLQGLSRQRKSLVEWEHPDLPFVEGPLEGPRVIDKYSPGQKFLKCDEPSEVELTPLPLGLRSVVLKEWKKFRLKSPVKVGKTRIQTCVWKKGIAFLFLIGWGGGEGWLNNGVKWKLAWFSKCQAPLGFRFINYVYLFCARHLEHLALFLCSPIHRCKAGLVAPTAFTPVYRTICVSYHHLGKWLVFLAKVNTM